LAHRCIRRDAIKTVAIEVRDGVIGRRLVDS
jgi:hypothetical protein